MKHRFEIHITPGPEDQRAAKVFRGFDSLEDAAAAALAIAQNRPDEQSALGSVYLTKQGKHGSELLGVASKRLHDKQPVFVEECRAGLTRALQSRKNAEARWKFMDERGGWDYWNVLKNNQAALDAYFKNDFATVDRLLPRDAQTKSEVVL